MSTFERIGREYLAQLAAFVIALAERILVPAIFLRMLGVEEFAAWSIGIAAAAYVSVLEFGTTRYFTNRLIRLCERGESAEAVREFRAGQLVVSGLAVLATVAILVVFRFSGGDSSDAMAPLAVAIPLVAASGIMQIVAVRRALYRAHREFARETWLGQLALIARVIAVLLAALAALPLVAVAWAWFAATLLFTLLPFYLDTRRRYPSFTDAPTWPDARDRRGMFLAAPGLWLQMLAMTLIQTGPIIAIGALSAGAFAVAQFVLLRTLANFVRQILQMFANLFSLELARRHAIGDDVGFAKVFMESNRFLAVQTAVASVALLLLAEPLFLLWTDDARMFDLPLLALAIVPPLLLPSTMGAIEAFAYANRPWPTVVARLAQLGVTVLAFLALPGLPLVARTMAALAIGEVLGLGIVLLARLPSLNRWLGPTHLLRLWWPSLMAGAVCAMLVWPTQLLPFDSEWLKLGCGLAAAGLALALTVWFIGFDRGRRAQLGPVIDRFLRRP